MKKCHNEQGHDFEPIVLPDGRAVIICEHCGEYQLIPSAAKEDVVWPAQPWVVPTVTIPWSPPNTYPWVEPKITYGDGWNNQQTAAADSVIFNTFADSAQRGGGASLVDIRNDGTRCTIFGD